MALLQRDAEWFSELLDNGMMSDITFVVGEERCIFRLHRLVLSSVNTVLREVVCGNNAKAVNELPDVNPYAFDTLVRYIYLNTFSLTSTSHACSVCLLSDQYQVATLKQNCLDYLTENLSPHSAVEIFEMASEIGESGMRSASWECIESNTVEAINNIKWENTKLTTIEYILDNVALDETVELEIYKKLFIWATEECKKKKLEVNSINLRSFLEPLLKKAVFLFGQTNELMENLEEDLKRREGKIVYVDDFRMSEGCTFSRDASNSNNNNGDKRIVITSSVFTTCKIERSITATGSFPSIRQRFISRYLDVNVYGVTFYLSTHKSKLLLPDVSTCTLTIRNVSKSREVQKTVPKLKNCYSDCLVKADEPCMIEKGDICEIMVDGVHRDNISLFCCNGKCCISSYYLEKYEDNIPCCKFIPRPHLHNICLWTVIAC